MLAFGARQVIGGLQLQPKSRVEVEKASKPDRRVRRHVAPLADDIADPVAGDADGLRQGVRREAEGRQVFLSEDFAGMGAQTGHDTLPSMVIHNLNAIRAGLSPDKADAPTIIDADTELPRPIGLQGL